MAEHFSQAIDLETAVIRGRVEEGRQHAAWLASQQPHRDLPLISGPHIVAVQSAASRAAGATTLDALALATADMALGCGGCHASYGGGLDYGVAAPPDESQSLAARMTRHVWAADRLWEALLQRSDDLWTVGNEVLGTSLVSGTEASWTSPGSEAVESVAHEVAELAEQAAQVYEWDRRSDVVGRLLTTCSRCHDEVGIDPLGRQ